MRWVSVRVRYLLRFLSISTDAKLESVVVWTIGRQEFNPSPSLSPAIPAARGGGEETMDTAARLTWLVYINGQPKRVDRVSRLRNSAASVLLTTTRLLKTFIALPWVCQHFLIIANGLLNPLDEFRVLTGDVQPFAEVGAEVEQQRRIMLLVVVEAPPSAGLALFV